MNWQDLVTAGKVEDMRAAVDRAYQWQQSIYRAAVLENPEGFYKEKERIASLLVDYHLGKLARKVRVLGQGAAGLTSDSFLNEWAEITFIISLWRRFDDLPDGLKLNLIYQSGPNITRKHLSALEGFGGRFVVVGCEYGMAENLLQRSVYLFDLDRKRYYLLLDFSFNRQPFERNYAVGEFYEGVGTAYPFPGSIRISVQNMSRKMGPQDISKVIPVHTMREAVERCFEALKKNPFCLPFPVHVQLTSDFVGGTWRITGSDGGKVHLAEISSKKADIFYAVTFRRSVRVVALITEAGLKPISFYNGDQLLSLESFTGEES